MRCRSLLRFRIETHQCGEATTFACWAFLPLIRKACLLSIVEPHPLVACHLGITR